MSDKPSATGSRRSSRANLPIALLLVIGVGAVYAYVSRPVKTPAGWSEDFAAAREQAAREGLPMFIDFSATWCPACNQMARDVLPAQRVADALHGFIPVHVDVDKERQVAAAFHVEVLPTFIVTNPAGREVYRFEGYRSVDEFVAEIAKARERL
jgi:thioredoxin-like negative regulator of GroEL